MKRIKGISNFRVFVFFILFMSILFTGRAQEDYGWWNKIHNWDGFSSWTNYIIYSPYYMGPNSLPVPFSQKGLVKDRYEIQFDVQSHYSRGGKTQNLFLSLYIPIIENVVAVEFYGVPIEQYHMDEGTVIERRTRKRSGEGIAAGDFYFNTIIQIIKDKKFADIALRMSCRTASGNKLGDARHTDAPGYFFDVSFGKNYNLNGNKKKLRIQAMLGFYAWQMNLQDNQQNDAVLYGFGLDLNSNKWIISNNLEGYAGYMGNRKIVVGNGKEAVPFRDRPLVYRLDIYRKTKSVDIGMGYQHGLLDYPYSTLKVSAIFHITKTQLFHKTQ